MKKRMMKIIKYYLFHVHIKENISYYLLFMPKKKAYIYVYDKLKKAEKDERKKVLKHINFRRKRSKESKH